MKKKKKQKKFVSSHAPDERINDGNAFSRSIIDYWHLSNNKKLSATAIILDEIFVGRDLSKSRPKHLGINCI